MGEPTGAKGWQKSNKMKSLTNSNKLETAKC
jgi:hypothetical protein